MKLVRLWATCFSRCLQLLTEHGLPSSPCSASPPVHLALSQSPAQYINGRPDCRSVITLQSLGGNAPSQCMRQHLFLINWAKQTMHADKRCRQPPKNTPNEEWYTNGKLNYSHHLSGHRLGAGKWWKGKKEDGEKERNEHSVIKLCPF